MRVCLLHNIFYFPFIMKLNILQLDNMTQLRCLHRSEYLYFDDPLHFYVDEIDYTIWTIFWSFGSFLQAWILWLYNNILINIPFMSQNIYIPRIPLKFMAFFKAPIPFLSMGIEDCSTFASTNSTCLYPLLSIKSNLITFHYNSIIYILKLPFYPARMSGEPPLSVQIEQFLELIKDKKLELQKFHNDLVVYEKFTHHKVVQS